MTTLNFPVYENLSDIYIYISMSEAISALHKLRQLFKKWEYVNLLMGMFQSIIKYTCLKIENHCKYTWTKKSLWYMYVTPI